MSISIAHTKLNVSSLCGLVAIFPGGEQGSDVHQPGKRLACRRPHQLREATHDRQGSETHLLHVPATDCEFIHVHPLTMCGQLCLENILNYNDFTCPDTLDKITGKVFTILPPLVNG